ncbi:MAG TPA: hypothetical protein DCW90_17875 [Lachnospiraceae bacterium]|nr:hypothetical protein [Lachnospiraceae bacterium]
MDITIIEPNTAIAVMASDDASYIMNEVLTILDHKYFIVGRTLDGARFYSEDIIWEDTAEMFQKYSAMVQFFGGGIVSLYEYTYDDYELVRDKVIL